MAHRVLMGVGQYALVWQRREADPVNMEGSTTVDVNVQGPDAPGLHHYLTASERIAMYRLIHEAIMDVKRPLDLVSLALSPVLAIHVIRDEDGLRITLSSDVVELDARVLDEEDFCELLAVLI